MTIASDLLHRHIEMLVADNRQWQTLIADEMAWELPYAPSIGHPARLSGRDEILRHVTWFLGAVANFRFYDVIVSALADPDAAVAEVKAEALIKSTGRIYRQHYVLFRCAAGGKIVFLREYFDPCARPRRWTRLLLALNPDTGGDDPACETQGAPGSSAPSAGRQTPRGAVPALAGRGCSRDIAKGRVCGRRAGGRAAVPRAVMTCSGQRGLSVRR